MCMIIGLIIEYKKADDFFFLISDIANAIKLLMLDSCNFQTGCLGWSCSHLTSITHIFFLLLLYGSCMAFSCLDDWQLFWSVEATSVLFWTRRELVLVPPKRQRLLTFFKFPYIWVYCTKFRPWSGKFLETSETILEFPERFPYSVPPRQKTVLAI